MNVVSLPSRERGLKSKDFKTSGDVKMVAPFTGAWIEISSAYGQSMVTWSLPSRERGLKSVSQPAKPVPTQVAPFTGAWIEILPDSISGDLYTGRSLHGSVD